MEHENRIERAKLEQWNLVGDVDKPYNPYVAGNDKRKPWGRRKAGDRGFSKEELDFLRKTYPRLKKVLDKSHWKFRVHFFILPWPGTVKRTGLQYFAGHEVKSIPLSEVKKAFQDYHEPYPGDGKDSINVILTGSFFNEGPGKRNMAPTPWIVIHNMAHALQSLFYSDFIFAVRNFVDDTYFLDDEGNRKFDYPFPDPAKGHYREFMSIVMDSRILETVFTFASARRGRIRNFGEGMLEIFTSFVHNGGKLGKVNPPPDYLRVEYGGSKYGVRVQRDVQERMKSHMDYFKGMLEEIADRALDRAVGKWYVDG